MRQTRWYLVATLLGLTLAQPARAAEQVKTRGDPKTTYDQSENKAHSGKDTQDTEAASTSSQASTSTTDQTDAAGHWLVRRVATPSGSQWTLYDSGEIKHVGGP